MRVQEIITENFLRNFIGDVRNAFKPGISITPNMIRELEDGVARLQRGEQPTPRQQKMMTTFLSTTMARELQRTFGIDINEGFGDWWRNAENPQDHQQDVLPVVKRLMDQGMSPQEIITQVERELGVRPRFIQQAIDMVRAGVAEQDVGGMATQRLTPEDELGWGFRFNDPEAYVRRMIASVPGGDGFIRPMFHQGGLIGVSTRPPQDTQAVQQFLQSQGYSVGNIDGAWGPRTQAALEQYLRDYRQQNASMADRLRGSQ